MKEYKPRLIDKVLEEYIPYAPVTLVEGAKDVGKTESCKRLSNSVFELDDLAQRSAVNANYGVVLQTSKPVLIDEWQFIKPLWNFLRRSVDNGLEQGSVILTGSNPKFNNDLHSGSGRIIRFKMRPFSIEEREMSKEYISLKKLFDKTSYKSLYIQTDLNINDYLDEIYLSGFPGIRDKPKKIINRLLTEYSENIVTHEFEENGIMIKKPASLMAWLKSYASVVATPAAYQTILDISMNNNLETPNRVTANFYKEALEMLNIVEEVPSWLAMGKITQNLSKTPKHFLVDPALVVSLLNISKEDLLFVPISKQIGKYNKSLFGQVFESFIYQSLRVYCDVNEFELSHLRSSDGKKEIDFIVQNGRKLIAIEVKAKQDIDYNDIKHLEWFEGEIGDEYQLTKVVIYTGNIAYINEYNVFVIPAGLLGC